MTFTPSDAELASRFCLHGDRDAFEALVVRHLGSLRRFLAVLCPGDAEMAADAEQEVLVKLHGSLGRWRGDGAFTTWLYTLARRAAADEVRRRVRERRRIDTFARRSRPLNEGLEVEADPEQAWMTVEAGRQVRLALATLPEPDRTLLYLKDGEDVPLDELVKIYGLNPGTIKSKLSRARARLRTLLKEECYA